MGYVLEGMFVMYEERDGKEGPEYTVVVAIGAEALRVYMAEGFDIEILEGVKPGDDLTIMARPYINKRQKISWTDGKIVGIG